MNKKSFTLAITTVFIWSTLTTVTKLLVSNIPNFEANFICGIFASLCMLIINIFTKKLYLLRQYKLNDYLIMAGLGFLGLFLYNVLFYFGVSKLSSAEACVLNYLWPIMIVVFSCLILKERMTSRKIVSLACSFLGIIILSVNSDLSNIGNKLFGSLAVIMAAVSYGLFSVLNKKTKYDQGIAMMIMWLTSGLLSLLGYFFEKWVSISLTQFLGLSWLGLIVDGYAYFAWALALNSSDDMASVANMAYLTPFLSLLVSSIVLKEKITINAILALVFIMGGIIIQSFDFKRKK